MGEPNGGPSSGVGQNSQEMVSSADKASTLALRITGYTQQVALPDWTVKDNVRFIPDDSTALCQPQFTI